MLPSPSLGPPLLSASWSPPLPCGMGLAVFAGAVVGCAGGVVTVACVGPDLWCAEAAGRGCASGERNDPVSGHGPDSVKARCGDRAFSWMTLKPACANGASRHIWQ